MQAPKPRNCVIQWNQYEGPLHYTARLGGGGIFYMTSPAYAQSEASDEQGSD